MKAGVIVDTGPLVALLNGRDTHHVWALAQFEDMAAPLLTCEAVLAEATYRVRQQPQGRLALLGMVEQGVLRVGLQVADHAKPLAALVRRYAGVPMSLADACLVRLAETLPAGCRVTILADRGFGDQKLFAFLGTLGFGYVIRFRGNILVTDAEGETRPAAEWVGKGGRARKLRGARVTAQGRQVGAVVCVHAKGMREPWCLAASDPEATAAVLVNHYARRWTIEPAFRDTKDLRFGMGLSAARIGEPTRRDRLLLVSAFAMALLTLLGATGERLGMDRQLKSNTSKTRSHSLFRQGCMLYELIPNMPEHRLAPLIAAFATAVSQASEFSGLFA